MLTVHQGDLARIEPVGFATAVVASVEAQIVASGQSEAHLASEGLADRAATFTVIVTEQTAMTVAPGTFKLVRSDGVPNQYIVAAFAGIVQGAACKGLVGTCLVEFPDLGTRRRLQTSLEGSGTVNITLTREYNFAASNLSSVAALVQESGIAVSSAEMTSLSVTTTITVFGQPESNPLADAVGANGLATALAIQLPTIRVSAASATSTPPAHPPNLPPDQPASPPAPPAPPMSPTATSSAERWPVVALACTNSAVLICIVVVIGLRRRKARSCKRSQRPLAMVPVVPSSAKRRDAPRTADASTGPDDASNVSTIADTLGALRTLPANEVVRIPSDGSMPRMSTPSVLSQVARRGGPLRGGGTPPRGGGTSRGLDFCPQWRPPTTNGTSASIAGHGAPPPYPPPSMALPTLQSLSPTRSAWEELPTVPAASNPKPVAPWRPRSRSPSSALPIREAPSLPLGGAARPVPGPGPVPVPVPPVPAPVPVPVLSCVMGEPDIMATDFDGSDAPADAASQLAAAAPTPRRIESDRIQELQANVEKRLADAQAARQRLQALQAMRQKRAPLLAAARFMAAARAGDQVLPPSRRAVEGKEPPPPPDEDAA